MKNLLLACVGIAVGTLFCLGGLYLWRGGRQMRNEGITVEATISKKFRKGSGLENYYAVFQFTDEQGKRQSIELKVHSRAWRSMDEGGTEQITYLPGRPETADYGPRWGKQILGWVFLFFSFVGGGMAVCGVADLARRLLRGTA